MNPFWSHFNVFLDRDGGCWDVLFTFYLLPNTKGIYGLILFVIL